MGGCHADADCSDAGNDARCVDNDSPAAVCYCTQDACSSDSQCGASEACACRGATYAGNQGNHCVPSNCEVDSDCGTGGYCSPSNMPNGIGLGGYYCHTASDECVNDSDCPTGGAGNEAFCVYESSSSRWQCHAFPIPV